MRKVILGLAVSLDGFIEGPNGEYDWCFADQDYGMSEFMSGIDAVFIGRKSYELAQTIDADPSNMPTLMKYVFSNTLHHVKEDAVIIKGDLKTQVEQIKNSHGKNIWLYGGASLTSALMNIKMVDELWLSVHPILLGSGKPLFSGIQHRIGLELTDTKTYSTGLVSLKYTLK